MSALRGHAVAEAAKCLIVMVKLGKKQTRYVLAVIAGDARVDLAAVKALLGGSYAAFADRARAEELAGSVTGTVLPFSYHSQLELIAAPTLAPITAPRQDRACALSTGQPACASNS